MKRSILFPVFALAFICLPLACQGPAQPDTPHPNRVVPVLKSLDSKNIAFSWNALPKGQTMKVRWKSASGRVAGETIVQGNEVVLSPDAGDEVLLFSFTPLEGDKEMTTYSAEMSASLGDPLGRIAANDTVGTVDIIIQRVLPAKTFSSDWCQATFGACPLLQDCYGSWFRINRTRADEVYRVTVSGFNRSNVASTVQFFIKVDALGQAEYVTNTQVTCISLNPAHLTAAGRFTIFDNGDFAFAMHTTESTTVSGKGILIQPLKNINSVVVEKLGGCQ